STVVKDFGCSELPKPGWLGAITRACSASLSMTGALRSSPMPGWRNRSGRPCPFSMASTLMPLTVMAAAGSCCGLPPAPRRLSSHPLAILWEIGSANGKPGALQFADCGLCFGGEIVTEPTCEIHNNLTYATHDGVELKGDLYLPAGPGPFPVIINVHGGYWRRGSPDTFQYLGPYLPARGSARFTVSSPLTKPPHENLPR